jgi:Homeodomain-like domain
MPHPGAPALLLRVGDHERLTGLVRSGSVRAALAQRARIVLLASEGVRNAEIAERVGVSRPTVNRWRARTDTDTRSSSPSCGMWPAPTPTSSCTW